jgi:hypothetical protein
MNAQQAVKFIDRLLDRSHHRKLNDLESKIVLQIWEDSTYKSIADLLSYEPDYIKQVAARLWKLLSKLLGEDICKGNIRSAIERYQSSIAIVDKYEPAAIELNARLGTDLKVSETLMISDRRQSIVVSIATITNTSIGSVYN